MASIGKDPNGRKRILFTASDGKRKTIRLGKMDLRQAERVRAKVESLLSAGITGAMDEETSKWVHTLDDTLHERLARAGLVRPREWTHATLEGLIDAFFDTIDVKPGTRTTYEQTRRSLEDYFSADTLLRSLTALDASKWRQSLRDAKLADATVSKRVKTARQIFRQGVRWEMLLSNPFDDLKAGSQTNRSRMHFVSREETAKVLDACPDAEWRLIFALSRYAGLRCPSEHLRLRWQDVDWDAGRLTVTSPKTEAHEGGESRIVPIFPELRPILLEAFEQAPDGAKWVIARYRDTNANLRTQLNRIIKRAGVTAWPRLFHNLRATRQTELAEAYPIHVVCAWLGNSRAVATDHYLQVTDAHFERAVTLSNVGAAQNAAQQASKGDCTDEQPAPVEGAEARSSTELADDCASVQSGKVTPTGFEPVLPG